jgi:hypothetical protein
MVPEFHHLDNANSKWNTSVMNVCVNETRVAFLVADF